MKRIYLIYLLLLTALAGCASVGGFMHEHPLLAGVIEQSIGKPVGYFYHQLEIRSFNPKNIQSIPIEDEDHQEYGIEMKFPLTKAEQQSTLSVRIRFDMRRETMDSTFKLDEYRYPNQPDVFKRNRNLIVEFIRVVEFRNNKVIFSKVFDIKTGSLGKPVQEYVATTKKRRR
jgi:hypothetical protein